MKTQIPQLGNALRDTDPTVVMDIGIGKNLKKGRTVEFDYDAFRTANREMGGKENNSNLTIRLAPILGTRALGHSYESTDNPEIHLNSDIILGKKRKTRKTLQHELQHQIDYNNSPPSNMRRKLNDIGHVVYTHPASAVPAATLPIMPVLNALDIALTHETIGEMLDKSTVIPSLGFAALVGTAGLYVFDKYERRARKAGRLNLPPVITIQRQK